VISSVGPLEWSFFIVDGSLFIVEDVCVDIQIGFFKKEIG
jgi:hypothetical protein